MQIMQISQDEQRTILAVLDAATRFGYGNLIAHLQTAWARRLMTHSQLPEKAARAATGGPGYPFLMQDDLVERGEWDETGERYRLKAVGRQT